MAFIAEGIVMMVAPMSSLDECVVEINDSYVDSTSLQSQKCHGSTQSTLHRVDGFLI